MFMSFWTPLWGHNTMAIVPPELITDDEDGISRTITEDIPTHFTFKIEAFSLLLKASIDRYETGVFHSGCYKWKLLLYPNANNNNNETNHISLYLAIAETNNLPHGWEVTVILRLFLHDQIRDNYLMVQDRRGRGRRFHGIKTEWGFDQSIPLKSFMDASNGYLVNDICLFGAEVIVCKEKSTGKGECLTMINNTIPTNHYWKIDNFSKLDSHCIDSETFVAGDQIWKVQLYPKGKGSGKGNWLSLYLALADPKTIPAGRKFYVKFGFRLVDQKYDKFHIHLLDQKYGKFHTQPKATHWFSASSQEHGWSRFTVLNHLHVDTFVLVRDTCIVEAEVTVIGVVNTLPEIYEEEAEQSSLRDAD